MNRIELASPEEPEARAIPLFCRCTSAEKIADHDTEPTHWLIYGNLKTNRIIIACTNCGERLEIA